MKREADISEEETETRIIVTPDKTEHMVCLPVGHWGGLEWLIAEDFISLEETVKIAWNGWHVDRDHTLGTTFETALGFAIQEAYVQYETWINGFTNDNTGEG